MKCTLNLILATGISVSMAACSRAKPNSSLQASAEADPSLLDDVVSFDKNIGSVRPYADNLSAISSITAAILNYNNLSDSGKFDLKRRFPNFLKMAKPFKISKYSTSSQEFSTVEALFVSSDSCVKAMMPLISSIAVSQAPIELGDQGKDFEYTQVGEELSKDKAFVNFQVVLSFKDKSYGTIHLNVAKDKAAAILTLADKIKNGDHSFFILNSDESKGVLMELLSKFYFSTGGDSVDLGYPGHPLQAASANLDYIYGVN